MKILIQNRKSKLFFKSINSWTPNEDEAANFSSALAALNFSSQQSLGDTEVIFRTKHDLASSNFAVKPPPIFAGKILE